MGANKYQKGIRNSSANSVNQAEICETMIAVLNSAFRF